MKHTSKFIQNCEAILRRQSHRAESVWDFGMEAAHEYNYMRIDEGKEPRPYLHEHLQGFKVGEVDLAAEQQHRRVSSNYSVESEYHIKGKYMRQ